MFHRASGGNAAANLIQDYLFPSVTTMQHTNRAFFTKFQHLFRY